MKQKPDKEGRGYLASACNGIASALQSLHHPNSPKLQEKCIMRASEIIKTFAALGGLVAVSLLLSAGGIPAGEPAAPGKEAAPLAKKPEEAKKPIDPKKPDNGAGAFVTGKYRNLFVEAGHTEQEVKERIAAAYKQLYHGDASTETLYYPAGSDDNGPMAYMPDIANNDVRSEGMSYGMMICVQLDKQDEFKALWNYSMHYMYQGDPKHPVYGFFTWHTRFDGTAIDELPAPDGEEYYAMALIFAANRWGNGKGIYDYKAQADKLLTNMVHRESITGQVRMNRGNTQQTVGKEVNDEYTQILFSPDAQRNNYTDPSYHLPAFYELWGRWGPEADRAFWLRAAEASREFFQKATNPKTGLAPNYCNFDGSALSRRSGTFGNAFREDAWRCASNWSVDWSWWAKDPRERELSDRIQAFFESKGMDTYGNNFSVDGNQTGNTHSTGLVATNAAASLAANDTARAKKFVAALWDAKIPSGRGRYYDGMLYMMNLLHCAGEYRIWPPK
jgi:oligosaccharide reducing-end xylanase